jgi:U5 small nuclear ribonucleoprotein component
MDPDLYDEFGNYIGPELESESEDSSEEEREEEDQEQKDEAMEQEDEEGGQSMAIVLHEVRLSN